MSINYYLIASLGFLFFFSACQNEQSVTQKAMEMIQNDAGIIVHDNRLRYPLPVLGNKEISPNGDTIYSTIRPFSFVNQLGDTVTNATFKDKIYVADFFFTSCPTICPKVTRQMLRLHDAFKDREGIMLVAHTIDPKRDTVDKLKKYADNLGVGAEKWLFLTGDKDALHAIAEDYFSIAHEDPDAPGGFNHSGKLILVDKKGRVRSYAEGTIPEQVDRFMEDIDWLLKAQQ